MGLRRETWEGEGEMREVVRKGIILPNSKQRRSSRVKIPSILGVLSTVVFATCYVTAILMQSQLGVRS